MHVGLNNVIKLRPYGAIQIRLLLLLLLLRSCAVQVTFLSLQCHQRVMKDA